ncbi:hypothetical protein AXF42_Ash018415 [Apostasia shenzhenica]|uniref:RIN4 pathogenic type III effector avirulence factor Avr cleavage site domain-containing protein n=1 Tax=Apostasia shenzhenica TaxID=1088818 RepID=A0A2I0BE98_9ASPA|nr:hypothetical protein AXF42_Ash018415 [Apostasia shenzhenica]
MKRWEIPAFGNWEYCEGMPITQYFESARQAGLIRPSMYGVGCEEDLFKVPVAVPVKSAYPSGGHCRRKVRQRNGIGEKQQYRPAEQQRRRGDGSVASVAEPPRRRTPKAVDEDLYKIPPELLYQKHKRKRMPRNLLSGCLGLNCVA